MFEGLKGILVSRKFWITTIGTGVITGLSALHVPPQVIMLVAGLFGLNIGAQGYADGAK